jgi:drug/metabolite transporter (DMT)-like permease
VIDVMIELNEHTKYGIISIFFGTIGIVLYLIGWFFYSFADNRLYGMVAGVILGILSIILGYIARKQGDSYGIIGIYLGIIPIIISLVIFLFATPIYVEYGYY